MVEYWIEAATALKLVGSSRTLLTRLRSGVIKSTAQTLVVENEQRQDTQLPAEFWTSDRYSHFIEDWEAGDFSNVVEHSEQWVALGVQFDFQAVLELLPFERRPLIKRQLSVAGNPAWLPAREARRFAWENCGIGVHCADEFILEHAKLGFLAARAVLAQGSRGQFDEVDWAWQVREWDVPTSFWEGMTFESTAQWDVGKFAAVSASPVGRRYVTLSSVHFSADSVRALANPTPIIGADTSTMDAPLIKPPLSLAKLNDWWAKKEGLKNALSEEELLTLARAAHPEHSISRDRIRELRGPTKRGPKPVSR